MNRAREVFAHYECAKAWVVSTSYSQEVEWQKSLASEELQESQFLREYAWVVLNSGFRESVVRAIFDYVSLCFCDWESAATINENARACLLTAKSAFNNQRKLDAVIWTSNYIEKIGFEGIKSQLLCAPLVSLRKLPFIGEVTARHLAKNLGWHYCKPDRHLVRLARTYVYKSVDAMCLDISNKAGDPIEVVDLILWRFEVENLKSTGNALYEASVPCG